jgi:hypothetical protein
MDPPFHILEELEKILTQGGVLKFFLVEMLGDSCV